MRSSTSALVSAAALISSASARIHGFSAPATIVPNQHFEVQLLTQNYIQSIYDVAVAFGINAPPSFPGSLGTPIGSFYLGPSQSNNLTPLNFTVTIPDRPAGPYILGASVMSLSGAAAGPGLLGWNVTVNVGTEVSTEKVQSTEFIHPSCWV